MNMSLEWLALALVFCALGLGKVISVKVEVKLDVVDLLKYLGERRKKR